MKALENHCLATSEQLVSGTHALVQQIVAVNASVKSIAASITLIEGSAKGHGVQSQPNEHALLVFKRELQSLVNAIVVLKGILSTHFNALQRHANAAKLQTDINGSPSTSALVLEVALDDCIQILAQLDRYEVGDVKLSLS